MADPQDGNAPLTVGFLTQVFSSFERRQEERFAAIEAKFEAKIDTSISGLRAEMIERIEDTETRLLKEFRKWAVRIESVGRVNETRSLGIEQRVAVLEERLNDLEDRA